MCIEKNDYQEMIKQEADFWDKHYIDTTYSSFAHEVDFIRENVTDKILEKIASLIKPGDKVLDYGCGKAWLSFLLAPSNAEITGVDIAPKCIFEANQKALCNNIVNCHFVCADLNYFILPNEYYDAVISFGAMHHLVHLDHAVQQISDSLKCDGLLILYECVERNGFHGIIADLIADFLHFIIPTDLSYHAKYVHALRKLSGKSSTIQELSPLEAIGSGNWLSEVSKHFDIIYQERWYAFITPFIGRIKKTIFSRYIIKALFNLDAFCVKHKILQPEMLFIIAKIKSK